MVSIYANIFKEERIGVVTLTSWKNRKQWIPPQLKSLAFDYSKSNMLLFNEIKESDRLYFTYRNMSSFMDVEGDDPVDFSMRLQMAFRFFEEEFKNNRINQSLVLSNAKPELRSKLIEVKDGTRISVDDHTNTFLLHVNANPNDWWEDFGPPPPPQVP